MGLNGYRLWAMGQLDSTCRAPQWVERLLGCPSRSLTAMKWVSQMSGGYSVSHSSLVKPTAGHR
jgi:hypothetical protein